MTDTGERADSERDDGLPSVTIPSIDASVEVVRRLQAIVLKHPVASKAAYSALMAEGRAFADTPEGARWKQIIARSDLLDRARLLLDLPGLSTLEEAEGSVLPSTLLDTIFMIASNSRNGEFVDTLLKWDTDDVPG